VQPWQVLATQSPVAGLLGRAARGTRALDCGATVVAQPAANKPADAPDAMMKVLRVSLMTLLLYCRIDRLGMGRLCIAEDGRDLRKSK
jgi:hypothetical protein